MPRTSLRTDLTAARSSLRQLQRILRSPRSARLACGISLLVLWSATLMASEPATAPGCTQRPSGLAGAGTLLALTFTDENLGQALQQIGQSAGFRLTTNELGGTVSAEYANHPAVEVLQDLGTRFNLVYVVTAPDSVLVQEVRFAGVSGLGMPEIVHKEAPPARVGKKRLTGRARMSMLVCADGSVGSVEVLSSKPSDFGPYAADAARQWRYRPAKDARGAAAPAYMATTIEVR